MKSSGEFVLNRRRSNAKFHSSLKDLSINKLQFSRLERLYGREKETENLAEVLELVTDPSTGSHQSLVLIQGVSGVGKTVLARQTQTPVHQKHGFYVEAKFDLQQNHEPYSGIKTACRLLSEQILALPGSSVANSSKSSATTTETGGASTSKSDPRSFKGIRDRLIAGLLENGEVAVDLLVKIVPNLIDILGKDFISGTSAASDKGDEDQTNQDDTVGYMEASNRLQFSFRRLIQIISSYCPLVFAFDDVHWADKASLDLVKVWVTDTGNQSLMIVLCARSNEVDEDHCLTKMVHQIQDKINEDNLVSVSMKKLEVGTISVENVNEMLVDLLSAPAEDTLALAKIVQQKSGGNPFYIVQYLLSLTEKELLCYNLGMLKWVWNEDSIRAQSSVTENVVDLMKAKVESVVEARQLLPVAACIGGTFEVSTIRVAMKGFLLPTISDRFIHDKVQEAAILSIPKERREDVHYQIGEILLKHRLEMSVGVIDTSSRGNIVFQVVNLLNHKVDPISDMTRRLEVTELNHLAGKKAMDVSAYDAARTYLGKAISLLPDDYWDTHFDRSLDLFSTAAEAEFCIGNYEQMEIYCNEVTEQRNCSMADKLRVCHVRIDALASQGQNDESLQFTMDVLAKFGCHFPKRGVTFALLANIARVKLMLRKLTPQYIESLPVIIGDKVQNDIMKTLDKCTTGAFWRSPELYMLVGLRMVWRTLEYGITYRAPQALYHLSYVVTNLLHDFVKGTMLAECGLSLQNKFKCKEGEVRDCLLYAFILHNKIPYKLCMPPLLGYYQKGMEAGCLQTATWSIFFALDFSYYAGDSLATIDEELATYTKQMRELNQLEQLQAELMTWQSVQNLLGRSENTTTLTGKAMVQDEVLSHCQEIGNYHAIAILQRLRVLLAMYFGEHDLGAELALTSDEQIINVTRGYAINVIVIFANSLSCFAAARKSKSNSSERKRYEKLGRKRRRAIKTFVQKGNPNCVPFLALLDAEKAALQGRTEDAIKEYKNAILLAGRRGLVHNQALANERLAEFHLEHGERDEAKYRLNEAIQLYSEWGAKKKVELLNHVHSDLLS